MPTLDVSIGRSLLQWPPQQFNGPWLVVERTHNKQGDTLSPLYVGRGPDRVAQMVDASRWLSTHPSRRHV